MKNIAIEITSKTGKDKLVVCEMIQKFSKEPIQNPVAYRTLRDFAFDSPGMFSVVLIKENRMDGTDKGSISHMNCDEHFKYPQDTTEIISHLMDIKEVIQVKIGNHTAVIDDTGIKVGCTQVTFEKFDEIAKAVKKVRKK